MTKTTETRAEQWDSEKFDIDGHAWVLKAEANAKVQARGASERERALEEAAKVAERYWGCQNIVDAIRALKGKP